MIAIPETAANVRGRRNAMYHAGNRPLAANDLHGTANFTYLCTLRKHCTVDAMLSRTVAQTQALWQFIAQPRVRLS